MSINVKISEFPDPEWNNRLKNHSLGSIHQTSQYCEFRKKMWGNSTHYITFEKNDEILGQIAVLGFSKMKKKIESKLGKSFVTKKLGNLVNSIKRMYVWYYGPIIFQNNFREEIFDEIANLSKKFNSPIKGSLHPLDLPSNELKNKGWNEIEKGTFIIDLTLSEEKLWDKIERQSGRKAVNRALKKDIKVKSIKNINDLKVHHFLLNEGREIANLPRIPFDRLKTHWEMLVDVGEVGFVAWLDDKPLASTIVTTFNGYLNEQGFARSKFDFENLTNGTDLIKWHIIKWGHRNGFKKFDLSGVDLDFKDKKHEGIFKFKKKWGGEFQKWYHYSTS